MPSSAEGLVAAAVAPREPGDLPARFALFPTSPEASAPAIAALQRDLAAFGSQIEQHNAAGEALLVLPEHRLADAPAAFAAADAIVDGYGFAVVEPEIIHAVMPVQRLGPESRAETESAELLPGCWVGEEDELKSRKRWALEAIAIPAAWALAKARSRPYQGQGIVIAQPDTGVTGHGELIGIRIIKPLNLLGDGKTPTDPTDPLIPEGNPGHGTATASVAVSPESLDVSGTAPAASLMPIRAIQSVVRLSQITTAQAIDHAVASGAHVITMSLGGIASFSLWRALERAVEADVIVLAAAGNCVSEVVWPARYKDCIAVAGIDAHDRAWPGTCRGSAVDISAPAQNVYRAAAQTGDAGQGQGTSFAVALTAGVAACWLAYHGRATAVGEARKRGETVQAMFRRLLCKTARVPAGWDSHRMGAGIVDAEALLKASFDDGLGEEAEETAVAAAIPSRGASVRDLATSVLGSAASALPVDWSRRDAEVSLALLTATQAGTESGASNTPSAVAKRLQHRVGGRDILMPHAMSISKQGIAMNLESITNSDAEVVVAPPKAVETLVTPAPVKPIPLPDTVKRRVVVGKSSTPMELPADTGLESVLGADERTRIVSTELYPWKLICALDIDAPWGSAIGTGWLVGPRTLITAGHCVYDRKQLGGWARKITVTPGRDRERTPFGSKVSARFSTLSPWLERQDADFDIAAIHLDQAFFSDQEVFRVGSFTDAELTDFLVNVSGYPASPGNGMELYWAKNRIKAVTPRRIFYDVDTSGGQSGGPSYVFPNENAHPIVVGIHAYGLGGTPSSIGLRVNSAPRIIPEVVEKIQEWIAADAAIS